METTFKYQDKIITTPNLEKKLKRMKLQLSDIEIIETPNKKEEPEVVDKWDKEKVIIRCKLDDIRRVCYVPKGTRPPIDELFKNVIYNPETKTGLYTREFLKTMYYEN